jgi:hypothetical protein
VGIIKIRENGPKWQKSSPRLRAKLSFAFLLRQSSVLAIHLVKILQPALGPRAGLQALGQGQQRQNQVLHQKRG